MPDTMRTLSALQAIINDNSSGDISAQDVRDFLVSAYQPQGVCGHRLTTESGVPVSTSDRTSQSTVYLTPYLHNRIGLYDGTSWIQLAVPEIAVVLAGLTSARNYDLFAAWSTPTHSSTNTGTDIVTWSSNPGWVTGTYVIVTSTGGGLTAGTPYWYNAASTTTGSFHTTLANALAGTSKVDLTANVTQTLVGVFIDLGPTWNTGSGSDTARGTGAGSTALTTQDGVYCNSVSVTGTIGGGTVAAKAGLYVGTIRTTGTTATEDSGGGSTTKVGGKRFVWSAYNRVPRHLTVIDTTDTWTYGSTAFRIADGATAPNNCVEAVFGLACEPAAADLLVIGQSSGGAPWFQIGIGLDSGSVNSAKANGIGYNANASSVYLSALAQYRGVPGLGYHYLSWLESSGAGTTTFDGDGGGNRQSGMQALVWG